MRLKQNICWKLYYLGQINYVNIVLNKGLVPNCLSKKVIITKFPNTYASSGQQIGVNPIDSEIII